MTGRDLVAVLLRSQGLGFLGPGPVDRHIEHGRGLLAGLPERGRVLDLGSGGGLPGLIVAHDRPALELTLLEARRRACRFLRDAVADLGRPGVAVVEARAEEAARRSGLRESFDAVVARSFGPAPVTAECAVGFLRPGGRLLVSEPPGGGDPSVRWPPDGLADLGFAPAVPGGAAPGAPGGPAGRHASFVTLEKVRSDERWPRRVGVPAKRPLWVT